MSGILDNGRGRNTREVNTTNNRCQQSGKSERNTVKSHRLYMKPLAGMKKQDRDEINKPKHKDTKTINY